MPGACSRVTMNALEEIGLSYEDIALDLISGQQKSPDYLAVNPRGKIPALLIGDRLLTENAAILLYLDRSYPHGGLLPVTGDSVADAQAISDLIWCSSSVHPVVRSIRMPIRLTEGDPEPVRARGMSMIQPIIEMINERLERGPWWFGADWSIVDVYLYWNYDTARSAGFDFSRYPAFVGHSQRVRDRPSFQRALARELAACERAAIQLPPGAEL